MAFFRQYIAPLLVVIVFLVALAAVTARSFLPGDMAAPAPVGTGGVGSTVAVKSEQPEQVANLPPALARLVQGIPDTSLQSESF